MLENLLDEGFTIKEMSTLLSVSESTIYRRMNRYGLNKFEFTDISDEELDAEINKITKEYPYCGENFIKEILFHKGVKVQRMRFIGLTKMESVQERRDDYTDVCIMSGDQITYGI